MRVMVLVAAVFSLALAGCGGGDGERAYLECYQVKGSVRVDGKAEQDVFVHLRPVKQNATDPFSGMGQTDLEGNFSISTYNSGDGAPAGDYVITVEWREKSGLLQDQYAGADRLKEKYADEKTSTFKFTVKESDDNVIPVLEVDTKPGAATGGPPSAPPAPGAN